MKALVARARRVARDAARGASAIVLGLSLTLMMAAAAFGFDIAKLYYERQMVRNAVDAAAQVGAAQLPTDGTAASRNALIDDVRQMVNRNYPAIPVTGTSAAIVQFYCMVANTSGSASVRSPDTTQFNIYNCNPGTNYAPAAVKCSASFCAVPCDDPSDRCNSIMVQVTRRVDFMFAPAINIPYGSTGAVSTVACNGECGGGARPNPLNVVVMADRTPSMNDTNAPAGSFTGLKDGIKSMLQYMDADQQYVAFGAIHKSVSHATLATPPASSDKLFTSMTPTSQISGYNSTSCPNSGYHWVVSGSKCYRTMGNSKFNGSWVPVGFTKDYNDKSDSLPHGSVTTTDLYRSVDQLTFSAATSYTDTYTNGVGTHLAASLKGAARYLLTSVDGDNYVPSLDPAGGLRRDLGVPPRNVIVFETDGRPEEIFTSSAGNVNVTDDSDIGAERDGEQGCRNLVEVASQAKARGITILTIGFGNAAKFTCKKGTTAGTGSLYNSGSMYVRDVLAQVASPRDGVAAAAGDCTTPAGRTEENADGDYFFCAANGSDLEGVFRTALNSFKDGTRYMAIDGLGD